MKPSELLESTGWCQYTYAMDNDGHDTCWEDKNACAFCVVGAIYNCYGSGNKGLKIEEELSNFLNTSDITSWNDDPERTKDEIVQALKAIGH